MTSKKSTGATPKTLDLSGDNYGQTPGRKEDECHVCHVERIAYIGTDDFLGLKVLVGEKCRWRVERSEDFAAYAL